MFHPNQILIEYQEAKKTYHHALKPTEGNAKGKACIHALRSTFEPVVDQPKKEFDCRPTPIQLPPDYNRAKALYRASKSRITARGGISAGSERAETKIGPSVSERSTVLNTEPRRTARVSSKPNIREVLTTPASSARSTELVSAPPTVESGLKALGLLRPMDNKAYEFGLAKGEKHDRCIIIIHLAYIYI
jgi:hypothetical protein